MGLTAEQRKVAKRIVKIGNRRGASPKEIKAALETGLVESNLRNLPGGDADSAGWRQERASLYKNPTNLKASINRFYDETGKVKAQYAHAGDLAAAVQRPAAQYRGRYQQRSGEAQQLMRSLSGGGGGGALGGGSAPSASPTYGPATTSTTPGVDNSGTRLQLKQAYLLNRHDPNALLELAVGLRDAGDVAGTTTVTPGKRLTGPAKTATGTGTGDGNALMAQVQSETRKINSAHVPYLWGGGHQAKQKPGSKVSPLDCSGAVSRALGINPRVASQFKAWGKAGRGKRLTVWAKDTHVLMEVDGRFWGTSGSNPGGGAGWIPRSQITKGYLAAFTARHPPGL